MIDKPYSQACENNKHPILAVLQRFLTTPCSLLEVGSGTGQHAVFFARSLPDITWQCSDLIENHPGILSWIADNPRDNLLPPLSLDVTEPWPDTEPYDAVFTANTLHIMPWNGVVCFFEGLAQHLAQHGMCIIYGPFNYQGQFTSDSNRAFDQHLKAMSPERGIRDIEAICAEAQGAGLTLLEDVAMPANNRCLVFQKVD